MLKHMNLERDGNKIENAVYKVIKSGKVSSHLFFCKVGEE